MRVSMLASMAGMAIAGSALAQGGPDIKVYKADYVPPIGIPDGAGNGTPGAPAFAPLFVQDHGPIFDLDVDIIIRHTWQGDLVIQLMAPNGLMIDLSNRPGVGAAGGFGFSTDDFGNPATGAKFFFDDEAAFAYDAGSPGAPVNQPVGNWRPEMPLGLFDGLDKFGEWKLVVTDLAGGDTGAILNFSLHVNNVPAPASLALLGLGALATGRRRR